MYEGFIAFSVFDAHETFYDAMKKILVAVLQMHDMTTVVVMCIIRWESYV